MNVKQHRRLSLVTLVVLAWRNLWRHRRRTLITLSSIGLGFAIAVLFIGLNDGAHNSMIRNAIHMGEGHLTVQPHSYLEAPANHKSLPDATSQTLAQITLNDAVIDPRISLQVLASTAHNSIGAVLEGMRVDTDQRGVMLKAFMVEGKWLLPGDKKGIIIGSGMASKLKAKVGSKIVVMVGRRGGDALSHLCRVRGIFSANVNEIDNYLILSALPFARLFLNDENSNNHAITRFAITLDHPNTLDHTKSALETLVGNKAEVLDWREMMPELVQFIAIDDASNYIFLVLILTMVVFGIINTVLMSVLERTREFGLLRALGLSRRQLLVLVFCESILLSVSALVVGWIAGGVTHAWFGTYGIDLTAILESGNAMGGTFTDPVIYTELSWARVGQLTGIIFSVTLATGIYPALKAARVTPVAALRT